MLCCFKQIFSLLGFVMGGIYLLVGFPGLLYNYFYVVDWSSTSIKNQFPHFFIRIGSNFHSNLISFFRIIELYPTGIYHIRFVGEFLLLILK